ncbi:MAG: thiol-disulfide oxidoreductase DCC family protein [Armatimonadota bacterium]
MRLAPPPDGKTWVLWDGECGFCRRTVQWLERRDRAQQFHTLPYQSAPSPPMTPELERACERAVHVITPEGRLLRAGRASLYLLQHVGWGPLAALLCWPPFIWVVEAVYWLVARNRGFVSRFLFRGEEDVTRASR